MTLSIAIAAGITVAVTGKLIYLLFLSGKTLSNATFFGRLVSRIEPARQAFVAGWKEQSGRYQFIAYSCIILTMALVSMLLYWLMPALDKVDDFGDKLRYCLLVFGVGVSTSLTMSFILIMLVYFLISVIGGWWSTKPYRFGNRTEAPAAPVVRTGNGVTAEKAETPERQNDAGSTEITDGVSKK